jgi:hypothetical protein
MLFFIATQIETFASKNVQSLRQMFKKQLLYTSDTFLLVALMTQ